MHDQLKYLDSFWVGMGRRPIIRISVHAWSDFRFLRKSKSVLNIDAKVSHRVLNLGMT